MLVLLNAMALTAAEPSSPDSVGPSLAQARAFAVSQGEALWKGYGAAPFEFLLVEPKQEALLCRVAKPDGFKADGKDDATGCARFVRGRTSMQDNLLAAMPLFGPPPTIVMGTPKTTGRTPASWLRTILHEHFHQWQFSLPDYFTRIDALGLKGGDETGMWALNYPFPYAREAVIAAQASASQALADAVITRGNPDFKARLADYLAKRAAFRATVSDKDWGYIEFQLWQEGVARWTEIQLGKSYPDADVAKSAALLEERTLKELRKPDLKGQGREFVYAFGAGEAMLLAACGPGWRDGYPKVLDLGSLLANASRNCAHPV